MSKEQDGRLTYKSQFGDHGFNIDPRNWMNIHKIADRLGEYEDIGTIEQFKLLMAIENANSSYGRGAPFNWCGEEAIEAPAGGLGCMFDE